MNGTARAALADARDRVNVELKDVRRWLNFQLERRPDGTHPLQPTPPTAEFLDDLPRQMAEASEQVAVLLIQRQELEEALLVADVELELELGSGNE